MPLKNSFLSIFFLVSGVVIHAQPNFWLKTLGNDSLIQVRYHVDFYEREASFNGVYYTEGSLQRFNFPFGTRQFKNGLYRGWLTYREFQFMDSLGNHQKDSVLWAEGQIRDFLPTGTWKKYHRNGKVSLERTYCEGKPCGDIRLFHDNGQLKLVGGLDERGLMHGLWKAYFPDGKPMHQIYFEHAQPSGWSKHYTGGGLFSEAFFTPNTYTNNYDSLKLYYPESGQLKALLFSTGNERKIWSFWDDKGNQTVVKGYGFLRGNLAVFQPGDLEAEVRNGFLSGPETRYSARNPSKVESRTVALRNDSTRFLRQTYYSNGILESEFGLWMPDRNNPGSIKLDGNFKYYHGNGKLANECTYAKGVLVGTFRRYNPQGTLVHECQFSSEPLAAGAPTFQIDEFMVSGEGVLDGTRRTWNDAGLLLSEESYSKGLRNGSWRTYHPNGKQASQSEFKEDRRVGKEQRWDETGNSIKISHKCAERNWGSGFLCSEHQGIMVTTDIGTCGNCRRGTSSGMFGLCSDCACKLQRCQYCGRDL